MDAVDRLADEPLDDADEETLSRLAAEFALRDPVPDDLVDRVRFALALDEVYAEVAQLQRDATLVGTRSGDTVAERITFSADQLTVMVSIAPADGTAVRVDGWLAPSDGAPRRWRVKLRTADGEWSDGPDEDGRFVLDGVPRGLAQLVFTPLSGAADFAGSPDAAPSVVTPTFELVAG